MGEAWDDAWEEMKAYIGFGQADVARLAALRPAVELRLPWLLDNFYAAALGFPGARAVLEGEDQVHHLRGSLARWVLEMLTGPHDAAYWERHRHIGEVHVRVRLPERYVFTAMNLIRRDLLSIAAEVVPDERERQATAQAIQRVTDLELAAISGAFHASHEALALRTQRADVDESEARARQTEAAARLGRFAANLAHEIRNPLAAISGTLQVVVGSEPDPRRKEVLGRLQEQIHRMDELVSDLQTYARPADPCLETMQLVDRAREALTLSGVGADMEVFGDSDTVGDAAYTRQILVNLLQNARDAAGPRGRVRVRVGPGPVIEVEDDGPGVAPALVERIFEPFVTTKTRGMGLGLATSLKLARAMGGQLELVAAHPAPDSRTGARFRLTFSRSVPPGFRASRADNGARTG